MQHNQAFTLIEVLIALTIIAIAMLAITQTINISINSTQKTQDRIIAHSIAMNLLSQMQAGLLPPPLDKAQNGQTFQVNKNWFWTINSTKETNYSVQVTIDVSHAHGDQPLTHLTGFILKP